MHYCFIEGRIAKADPEIKTTANGKTLAKFTLCSPEGYGENKTNVFFPCIAWGKTAEVISKYFKKGSVMLATVQYKPNIYTNKNGNNVLSLQFVIKELHFPLRDKSNAEEDGFNPIIGTSSDSTNVAEIAGDISGFEEISTSDDQLPF